MNDEAIAASLKQKFCGLLEPYKKQMTPTNADGDREPPRGEDVGKQAAAILVVVTMLTGEKFFEFSNAWAAWQKVQRYEGEIDHEVLEETLADFIEAFESQVDAIRGAG